MNQLPAQESSGRLLSIDALRGFDMFWIVGGGALVEAIARWSDSKIGRAIETQLSHVQWDGFHFEDLIFPLFLFLVGAVLPFSLGKLGPHGRAAYARIFRRTFLLFALGLICNKIQDFRWAELRVAGVLQRIAVCYGIAALIVMHTKIRGQVILFVAILMGYWALMANVGAPGSTAGDYSAAGNLAGWVDRHYLPGDIKPEYYGFGDNEGLLSTIPAVATALLGALAGQWLRSGQSPWRKAGGLAVAGVGFLIAGLLWGGKFPVIKNLWTSSFVCVAGGFSLLLLALFYAIIDVLGFRRWAFFFVVIGANAITIYVVPRFVDFEKMARFFLSGVYRLSETHGSRDLRQIVAAAGVLAFEWIFLLILYRKRIFLRV